MTNAPAPRTIRAATAADHPVLVAFNLRHAAEVEDLALDPATVAAGVQAVLDDPAKGQYWVLEANGDVQASLLITYEWSDWRNRQVWWIQSVYIIPEARGQGLYQQLHQHIAALAKAQHVGLLRLYVYTGNDTAMRSYARAGMQGGHYVVYEQAL